MTHEEWFNNVTIEPPPAGWWGLGTVHGGPFYTHTGTYNISGTYGSRNPVWTPAGWTYSWHAGLDIAAPQGTPLIAVCDAVVDVNANDPDGAGYWVRLRHVPTGTLFHYFHMESTAMPAVGSTVSKGQVIGAVGSTGKSTGPHLHFEVLLGGNHVDPLTYLVDAYNVGEEPPAPPPHIGPYTEFVYSGYDDDPEWDEKYHIYVETVQSHEWGPYTELVPLGPERNGYGFELRIQDWTD